LGINGFAHKSHVIPANAGIQEATSLAEVSNRSAPLAPPRRGPWIPAFAGMSASVMLPCQEGESPSDVKS